MSKRELLRVINNPLDFIKRVFEKAITARIKYAEKGDYDAARYWHDRLAKHRFSIRGVGDEGLSAKQNEKEYIEAASVFKDLCHQGRIVFEDTRVLDIGCGNGFYASLLADLGVKEYTGIDITDVLFADLRKRFPRFTFVKKDLATQEIEGQFDLIIMIDVCQHIVNDSKFSYAMQNVKHCLSENGVFIVTSYLSKNSRLNVFYVKNHPMQAFETEFVHYSFSEPRRFRDKYIFSIKKDGL